MDENKRKNRIRLISGALCLALLLAFALRASAVLPPLRTDYGATWSMYRQEPENSIDVLVFGSSLAYCDVVPAVIYEESGLASYVMAGPEQTLSQSYYYIREALKTQSPSVILLELTGVMYERYQDYTVVNVGYMPLFSPERLGAVFRASEPEERFGLLFPLYNYHDRWENLRWFFSPRPDEIQDPLAGYTLLDTAQPQQEPSDREFTTAEDVFAENCAWLQRIRALCEQRGIRLVLFEVPTCAPIPETWMERIRAAAGSGAEIVDFNARFAELGLDLEGDFYDRLHLNVHGAKKFSQTLAGFLRETGVAPAQTRDAALWSERIAALPDG